MRIFLQKVELLFTFCINFSQPATTWFVARQVWKWVVRRATSFFNSFCSNVAKQGGNYMRPGRTQAGTNFSFVQSFSWDRYETLRWLHETGTNSKTGDSCSYITCYSLNVLTGTPFTPFKTVRREPQILLIPENCELYLTLWIRFWAGPM